MATFAVRWLKMARRGDFDAFGKEATESTIQRTQEGFAALKKILGLE